VRGASRGRSERVFRTEHRYELSIKEDLALGDGAQRLDELEPLVRAVARLDLVEPLHRALDHRLHGTLELTMLLAQEQDVRVQRSVVASVVGDLRDRLEEARRRLEVCRLSATRSASQMPLSTERSKRTLRVCFSSTSSLSTASTGLPACARLPHQCTARGRDIRARTDLG
jgi:hypothetical protein